ncbi:MAG: ABC transporter permease [Chlorobi bacterium]|nr:ABC transporter permease [Chlorobiota bacterium]
MRTILFILQKEFLQIFRNKTMIPIIFVVPVIQLIVLVHAATLEVKNIEMIVIDKNLSQTSRKLISKFEGSPFFKVKAATFSMEEAYNKITNDEATVLLVIPEDFENRLISEGKSNIQISINAINGMVAGLSNAYASSIITDFNKEIIPDIVTIPDKSLLAIKNINITNSYWYNPDLNYKNFMVPGILVLLVTIIGLFLSSMNVVREKEIGTIEQINVTPIKKYQFIIGKLLPFLAIALFDLAFGLSIGKLLFDIPIVGSLWLVFGMTIVYLLVVLGVGLFISTLTNTQQQAMFISFFFMIVFIMMSGLFTPIESMPDWAIEFDRINPLVYFMRIMRMILLKGSMFNDIKADFYSLLIFAFISLGLATWRYRKVA